MAIAPLIIAIRTTGAAALNRLGNQFRRLGANIRTSTNRWLNNFIQRGGLANTMIGRMAASMGRAGQRMGQSLSRSVQNAIQSLPASVTPTTVAAGAAIAAVLGTAIGAALNGAILAAVGGGVMALGIATAIKNSNQLQSAFSDVFSPIGESMKDFAKGEFTEPLLRTAEVFRNAWSRSGDEVRRMFSEAAKSVEPLARGLAGMAERALPGIEAAVKASGPVLRELASVLPGLGAAISDMFQSFAQGSEGGARALRMFIMWLSGTVIAVGNTVEFLSKGFQRITDAAEAFTDWLASLPLVGDSFRGLADGMSQLNGSIQGSARAMEGHRTSATGSAVALERQAEAARQAGIAAQALSAQLSLLIGDNMSAQQAAIAYEAAIDQLTESIRQNGVTTDIGTEKGRENVQVVLAAVQAANAKREAAIQLAGGEKASADAVHAANAAFNAQLDQLAAVMRRAGMTEEQVNQLLGTYRSLANQSDIYKTITVERKLLGPSLGGAFGYRGLATGGPAKAGKTYVVGEQGPELVTFGSNGYVHDANSSRRMMAGRPPSGGSRGTASGGTFVYDGPRGGLDALFATWFEQMVRKGRIRLA